MFILKSLLEKVEFMYYFEMLLNSKAILRLNLLMGQYQCRCDGVTVITKVSSKWEMSLGPGQALAPLCCKMFTEPPGRLLV